MAPTKKSKTLLRKISDFVGLYQLQTNGEKELKMEVGKKDISYYTDFFKTQLLDERFSIDFLYKIFKYGFTDIEIIEIFDDPSRFYNFTNNISNYRKIHNQYILDLQTDVLNSSKDTLSTFSDVTKLQTQLQSYVIDTECSFLGQFPG